MLQFAVVVFSSKEPCYAGPIGLGQRAAGDHDLGGWVFGRISGR